ncbi:protein sel-1 homolog 1 [Chironomus tepperi]|uniref:protein sel-1 homolog 1 n=1 Tax=Chironomus tepperi TaxID=113505 RepID=UPI00391F640D
MKYNLVILIFATILISYSFGDLEPPESAERDKLKQYERKSAKGLDDSSQEDETPKRTDSEEDEKFLKLIREELNLPTGGIKIVKAPDLSKDNEGKAVTESITKILESQEKWIQQFEEELDEINKKEQTNEIVEVEKTAEEIEADNLYDQALAILNKTKASNRAEGFSLLRKAAEKGHKMAKINIAWAQLLGNPLELRIETAKQTFVELADKGVSEAHMALGFMYATGIGFNVSQSKALIHYTMAAIGDNSFAQMVMGYRYWAGITLVNSCEKALDFYRKVASKVAAEVTFSGGPAIHRVRLLDEVENSGLSSGVLDNDLIDYYELLANKGDIQAQVGLGQLHYQGGRGIPLDHKKALSYFLPAANAGNAVAMGFLGKIYLEGSENIKADNDTAYKYFKKAADLGNPVGQTGLGIMYLQGKGVQKDTEKALKYFTQAADQGWVEGQLQLGLMYYGGIGIKRDFKLANKYFNLASQSGHVLAFYNLAQMHSSGVGMIRSCPTAVELFKNVAERGKWGERLMVAYQDYRSYKYDEAFMQYAFLAELGYEVAQSNAAFLLDRNEIKMFNNNRQEELVRALQYWGRASGQGYSAAQVKLGDYHYYGLGTGIVDYEAAASHYRTASEQQHNAMAMFNLAYMHEQGLGMKKDIHLAKRFYDLAAETNSDAKIPVALALLKLQVLNKFESILDKENNIFKSMGLNENIASNWDLYLITIITILLGMIIYSRRPPPETPQPSPQPQTNSENSANRDDSQNESNNDNSQQNQTNNNDGLQ